ncbi:hypothetical protein [Moritella viscosa]|nr:hypothetical protein [Moritella viscosa]SGZ02179.1 Putative uncharacterized protein [Moritella viscosa]
MNVNLQRQKAKPDPIHDTGTTMSINIAELNLSHQVNDMMD